MWANHGRRSAGSRTRQGGLRTCSHTVARRVLMEALINTGRDRTHVMLVAAASGLSQTRSCMIWLHPFRTMLALSYNSIVYPYYTGYDTRKLNLLDHDRKSSTQDPLVAGYRQQYLSDAPSPCPTPQPILTSLPTSQFSSSHTVLIPGCETTNPSAPLPASGDASSVTRICRRRGGVGSSGRGWIPS